MAPEFENLTEEEKKAVEESFDTQIDFMAAHDFYTNPANRQFRKLAVSEIATHCKSIDADAFVPYLAMNYFDRFISKSKKPYSDVEEVRKVAMTCLFMAATDRAYPEYFFPETTPLDFNTEVIEEQISDVLQFELAVTPFSFLGYFYPPFEEIGGIRRCCINKIIVQAQGEDDFNTHNFTPAEIAFSSLLAAADIVYPSIQIKHERMPVSATLGFCVKLLVDLCTKQNIMIERACSSSAAVAKPYHLGAAAETQTESGQQRNKKRKAIALGVDEIEDDDDDDDDNDDDDDDDEDNDDDDDDDDDDNDDDDDLVELYPSEAPRRHMHFYLQWPTMVAD